MENTLFGRKSTIGQTNMGLFFYGYLGLHNTLCTSCRRKTFNLTKQISQIMENIAKREHIAWLMVESGLFPWAMVKLTLLILFFRHFMWGHENQQTGKRRVLLWVRIL